MKEHCHIQDQMTIERNHMLLMYKIRLYNQFDLVNTLLLALFETCQLLNCIFFTGQALLTLPLDGPLSQ